LSNQSLLFDELSSQPYKQDMEYFGNAALKGKTRKAKKPSRFKLDGFF
jgi:hypothetical protein